MVESQNYNASAGCCNVRLHFRWIPVHLEQCLEVIHVCHVLELVECLLFAILCSGWDFSGCYLFLTTGLKLRVAVAFLLRRSFSGPLHRSIRPLLFNRSLRVELNHFSRYHLLDLGHPSNLQFVHVDRYSFLFRFILFCQWDIWLDQSRLITRYLIFILSID